MLEGVASVHRRQVAKRHSVSVLDDIADVAKVLGRVVEPSENGLASLLRRIELKTHLLAATRVLERLMEEEVRRPTVLSVLPLRDLLQVALAAEPALQVSTKPGGLAFRFEKEHYYSRNEATERLGVSEQTFDGWVTRGLISDVQIRRLGNKRFVFLSRAQVDTIRRRLARLMPVERFIADMAIDWSTYFAMRRCGMLQPILVGDVRHIARQQVTATQVLLEDVSVPFDTHELMAVPLLSSQAIKAAGGQLAFGEVLRRVLSRQIPLTRALDRPGWSGFLLPSRALPRVAHVRKASLACRREASTREQGHLFDESLWSI